MQLRDFLLSSTPVFYARSSVLPVKDEEGYSFA